MHVPRASGGPGLRVIEGALVDISCPHQVHKVKSHRQELLFQLPARRGFVNITPQVEAAWGASGVHEGLCLVNAMHISASVFINDNEGGLHDDFEKWLERLAREKPPNKYRHNDTGEDNA